MPNSTTITLQTLLPEQLRLVKTLTDHQVAFIVIGGHAVRAYSQHRPTFDLDILLSRSKNNAKKTELALSKITKISIDKPLNSLLTQENKRLPLSNGSVHYADLLTSIDHIEFAKCFANSRETTIGGIILRIPCLDDLIRMKEISRDSNQNVTKKHLDQEDLDALKLIQKTVASTVV